MFCLLYVMVDEDRMLFKTKDMQLHFRRAMGAIMNI